MKIWRDRNLKSVKKVNRNQKICLMTPIGGKVTAKTKFSLPKRPHKNCKKLNKISTRLMKKCYRYLKKYLKNKREKKWIPREILENIWKNQRYGAGKVIP